MKELTPQSFWAGLVANYQFLGLFQENPFVKELTPQSFWAGLVANYQFLGLFNKNPFVKELIPLKGALNRVPAQHGD